MLGQEHRVQHGDDLALAGAAPLVRVLRADGGLRVGVGPAAFGLDERIGLRLERVSHALERADLIEQPLRRREGEALQQHGIVIPEGDLRRGLSVRGEGRRRLDKVRDGGLHILARGRGRKEAQRKGLRLFQLHDHAHRLAGLRDSRGCFLRGPRRNGAESEAQKHHRGQQERKSLSSFHAQFLL